MIMSYFQKDRCRAVRFILLFLSVLGSMLLFCSCGKNENSLSDESVLGTRYELTVSNGSYSPTIWSMSFDPDQKTYKEKISVGETESVLSEGTYSWDSEGHRVTCTDKDGKTSTYIRYGIYILAEGYFYEGQNYGEGTPSGLYTMNGSNEVVEYIQFEGNNFSAFTDNSTPITGTWVADGKVIRLSAENGTTLIPLVMYDGNKLTNAYYIRKE